MEDALEEGWLKGAAEKTAKFGDDMGVRFMLVECPHCKLGRAICLVLLPARNTNKYRTLSIVTHLNEIVITKSLKNHRASNKDFTRGNF